MITQFKIFESTKVNWEAIIIRALNTDGLSHIENILLDDVDVNEIAGDGFTPLMILAYHANRMVVDNSSFELFKILIDKGADWNILNDEGDDFIDILNQKKLSEPLKNKIIEYYPEKYNEYIMKKEADKYNL